MKKKKISIIPIAIVVIILALVIFFIVNSNNSGNANQSSFARYYSCEEVNKIFPRVAIPNDQYTCEQKNSLDSGQIILRSSSEEKENDYEGLLIKDINYDSSILVNGNKDYAPILVSFDCNNDGIFEDALNINVNQETEFTKMRRFSKESCSGKADLLLTTESFNGFEIYKVTIK